MASAAMSGGYSCTLEREGGGAFCSPVSATMCTGAGDLSDPSSPPADDDLRCCFASSSRIRRVASRPSHRGIFRVGAADDGEEEDEGSESE